MAIKFASVVRLNAGNAKVISLQKEFLDLKVDFTGAFATIAICLFTIAGM